MIEGKEQMEENRTERESESKAGGSDHQVFLESSVISGDLLLHPFALSHICLVRFLHLPRSLSRSNILLTCSITKVTVKSVTRKTLILSLSPLTCHTVKV